MAEKVFAGDAYQPRGQDVITWAGICPWHHTMAFGTDKGSIIVTPGDPGDRKALRDRLSIRQCKEAVNSVAFLEEFVAATTRSEVIIAKKRTHSDGDKRNRHAIYIDDFGGHNVVSIKDQDLFLISENADGLLILRPGYSSVSCRGMSLTNSNSPVYKIAKAGRILADGLAGELITTACRYGGINSFIVNKDLIFKEYKNEGVPKWTRMSHEFPDVDIIDIQPTKSSVLPHRAVALSQDGQLIFIPNLMGVEPAPFTIKPKQDIIEAFALVAADDSLFVLSQGMLHCLPGILSRWTSNGIPQTTIESFSITIDASDLMLYGEKGFIVLTEEHAVVFDARQFVKSGTSSASYSKGPRKKLPSKSQSVAFKWKVNEDDFALFENQWDPNEKLTMDRGKERVFEMSK
jgi:hypothetical protein